MENISVSVRLRSLSKQEEKEGSAWRVDGGCIIPVDGDSRRDSDARRDTNDARRSSNYTADHVFGPECPTEQVYKEAIQALVRDAVEGKNVTIMTYGQTGSGKTYTMGTPESPGIIQKALMEMFGLIAEKSERDFLLRFSYLEIYNENVTDLLSPDKQPKGLLIKEDRVVGPVVLGLSEEIVTCPEDVLRLLKQGETKRHVASSKMNERSNRSHSVARMVLESRPADPADAPASTSAPVPSATSSSAIPVVVSSLVLVDLAGSESVAKTGAEGERLKESSAINKSLLALGEVVFKLSEGALAAGAHIPYRDSKLTRILKPSLGGNAKTMIICTINPAMRHLEESHRTLRFACRAKRVVNTVVVTEVVSETAALRWQAKELKEQQRRKAEAENAAAARAKAQIEALKVELLRSEEERARAEKEAEAAKQLVLQTLDRVGDTPVRSSHSRNRSWSPNNASFPGTVDTEWGLLGAEKSTTTTTAAADPAACDAGGPSPAPGGVPAAPLLACSPQIGRTQPGLSPAQTPAAALDAVSKLSPDKAAAAALLETCRQSKAGPASSRDLQEAIDRWRAENARLAEENSQLRHDLQPHLKQELQWLTATIATHEALNAQLQAERDAALQLVEGLQAENAELQRAVAEAHRQRSQVAARLAENAEALAAASGRSGELEALVRHLQKEVEAANETVESVKARSRSAQAEAQQAAERHEAETAELREQLSALLDELDATQQKLRASEAARSTELGGTRAYGEGGIHAALQHRQHNRHNHHTPHDKDQEPQPSQQLRSPYSQPPQPQHSQQASQAHASSICLPQPPRHDPAALAAADADAAALTVSDSADSRPEVSSSSVGGGYGLAAEVSADALTQLCRQYVSAEPSLLDSMPPPLPPLPVLPISRPSSSSSSITATTISTTTSADTRRLGAPSAMASTGSVAAFIRRMTAPGANTAATTVMTRPDGMTWTVRSGASSGGASGATTAAAAVGGGDDGVPSGSVGSRSWTASSRRTAQPSASSSSSQQQSDVRSSTAGSSLAAKAARAAAAVAAALRASTSAVLNATSGMRSAGGFSVSLSDNEEEEEEEEDKQDSVHRPGQGDQLEAKTTAESARQQRPHPQPQPQQQQQPSLSQRDQVSARVGSVMAVAAAVQDPRLLVEPQPQEPHSEKEETDEADDDDSDYVPEELSDLSSSDDDDDGGEDEDEEAASVSELAAQLVEVQFVSARQEAVIADLEAQLAAALADAEALRQQARTGELLTQRTDSDARTPELTAALEAALEAAELALLKAEGRAAALADERDALQERLLAATAAAEEAREALARHVAEGTVVATVAAGSGGGRLQATRQDTEPQPQVDMEVDEEEALPEGPAGAEAEQILDHDVTDLSDSDSDGTDEEDAEDYEAEVLGLREEITVLQSHLRSAMSAKEAAEQEADRLRATLEDYQSRLQKAGTEIAGLRREAQHRAAELLATRRAMEEREAKLAALRATLLVCELPSREPFGTTLGGAAGARGGAGGGGAAAVGGVGATTPGRPQGAAGARDPAPASPAAATAATPPPAALQGGIAPRTAAAAATVAADVSAPGSAPPGTKTRRVVVRGTPGAEMLFRRSVASRRLSPREKGAAAIAAAASLTPMGLRRRYASDSNDEDGTPSPDVSRRDVSRRDTHKRHKPPSITLKSRGGGGGGTTDTLVSELFERLDRLERIHTTTTNANNNNNMKTSNSSTSRPRRSRVGCLAASRSVARMMATAAAASRNHHKKQQQQEQQLLDVKAHLCSTGCGLQLTAPHVEHMDASASLPRDQNAPVVAVLTPGTSAGAGGGVGGPAAISAQLSITLRRVK